LSDDRQELWRRELAERHHDLVDQTRDREVTGNRDQEKKGRKQRKEKVVSELRCHAEAVEFEEGVDERSPEDLSPGKSDSKTS